MRSFFEQTEGFSGAEIEQLIVSAMYQRYADKSLVDTDTLVSLARETKPLSVLMAEKISGLRHWAEGRATKVS